MFSQTCVTTCTANDKTCLKCDNIYPDITGPAAALVTTTAKNLTDWAIVKTAIDTTYTDYSVIKGFQCVCAPGEVWDFVRMRCFNSLLI